MLGHREELLRGWIYLTWYRAELLGHRVELVGHWMELPRYRVELARHRVELLWHRMILLLLPLVNNLWILYKLLYLRLLWRNELLFIENGGGLALLRNLNALFIPLDGAALLDFVGEHRLGVNLLQVLGCLSELVTAHGEAGTLGAGLPLELVGRLSVESWLLLL